MPPLNDSMRYPDEAEDGLGADFLQERFIDYFAECRHLQKSYAEQIRLFTAFETETYPGSLDYVRQLIGATKPDYVVGSVHHVCGIGIDVSPALYEQAAAAAGGLEALYLGYFDAQYAMIEELQPAVVGHFDLIRIFDGQYPETLQRPVVAARIERNLEQIAKRDLIMDFNLRGFDKTGEPYPSMPVLKQALGLGICVVPGDDSHGSGSVGRHYDRGIDILRELGHDCQWREPLVGSSSMR